MKDFTRSVGVREYQQPACFKLFGDLSGVISSLIRLTAARWSLDHNQLSTGTQGAVDRGSHSWKQVRNRLKSKFSPYRVKKRHQIGPKYRPEAEFQDFCYELFSAFRVLEPALSMFFSLLYRDRLYRWIPYRLLPR